MATPIDLFDYDLPDDLIAYEPVQKRDKCRLLHVDISGGKVHDNIFTDILDMVGDNSFLVVNNTKVYNARLNAQKQTGGLLEFFVTKVISDTECEALIKGRVRQDMVIELPSGATAILKSVDSDGVWRATTSHNILEIMDKYGSVPLPPYIARKAESKDKSDYQTVYSSVQGSVAAPTAGLHFTDDLMQKLKAKGVDILEVTLDVGIGTFRPIKTKTLEEHKMHSERYYISSDVCNKINEYKRMGKKLIAVGSTTVRALESACDNDGLLNSGEHHTDIMISPPYQFKIVDGMVTNFHLPKSSLLAMVTAFGGYELIMGAYKHAIEQKYRFFSYGDAMIMLK